MLDVVEGQNDMPLALERRLTPTTEGFQGPTVEKDDAKLNISVIFTSAESTLAALKRAGTLAGNLGARVMLLVPQVVPYPLPLESPPVLLDWNERRFHAIAKASPVETVVRLYLCRDSLETLMDALNPRSLVVIGSRKQRWRFTRERKLARELRRAGHQVILTE
jgi:hypothetical protein